MREIFKELELWNAAGKPIAIATNVKKQGASLRPLGAKMAMTPQQEIAGSVTGGCIEGVVFEEAQAVMNSGEPKLIHYGVVSNETPWEVGLSCGGTLDVFIESFASPAWQAVYPTFKNCLLANRCTAIATIISGPDTGSKLLISSDGSSAGGFSSIALENEVRQWINLQMDRQESSWQEFVINGERYEVFADILVPISRLFIIGAAHIAIPLVTLAKELGFSTIVIDPRAAFATTERFPHADQLLVEWPTQALERLNLDEGSYVAALSHDEKIDNPALRVALASPARYVGVLGARKNVPLRLQALREMGLTDAQLARLHAPIGIPIGAELPEEIALAVLAEIIAAKRSNRRPQSTQVTEPVSLVS